MPELIVELLSEEMPAKLQQQGVEKLGEILRESLEALSINSFDITCLSTARRLILHIPALPKTRPGVTTEQRGPRIDAPAKAIDGFLKANGLRSTDECEKRETEKGTFWFMVKKHPEAELADLLPGLLSDSINKMVWPKSMRFASQTFRWIRPLRRILVVFDGKPLEGRLETGESPIIFSRTSLGHYRHAPEEFSAPDFKSFIQALRKRFVEPDAEKRKAEIRHLLDSTKPKKAGRPHADEALISENAGLIEWPSVLHGRFDSSFLDLPRAVIIEVLRSHQKCFCFCDEDGSILPFFAAVADMPPEAKEAAILAGYERIIRARLSDARFFMEQDRKKTLEAHRDGLQNIVFHRKLGTLEERSNRLVKLSGFIATALSFPKEFIAQTEKAAFLAKADLVTLTVGEFPHLQGIVGGDLARKESLDIDLANAIEEQYLPTGPESRCPDAPLSIILALSDKIEHLTSLWLAGEAPTGSKDPFALRRAGLGIIRLILENNLRLNLKPVFSRACALCPIEGEVSDALLAFLAERLRVYLRHEEITHNAIQAVFQRARDDDLSRLVGHIRAVHKIMADEDGAHLLVAWRRCAHILEDEKATELMASSEIPDETRLQEASEKALFTAIQTAEGTIQQALDNEEFDKAMRQMAGLRAPIDAFFEKVRVNDANADLRKNRLLLLAFFCKTASSIAQFDAF